VGKLKREDAISLLREIMSACVSFNTAQAVSVAMDKESKRYVLSVNWTPHPSEIGCLDKILLDRNLETITAQGRTIFRSRQKNDTLEN
jgi:hypothetical protein